MAGARRPLNGIRALTTAGESRTCQTVSCPIPEITDRDTWVGGDSRRRADADAGTRQKANVTTALRGILPPMTTPFDENGELDLARVDDQVGDRRGAREPDAWLGAVTF